MPPTAAVRSTGGTLHHRMKTKLWWLTGLCALLAGGLIFSSFGQKASTIHIRFKDGHGLKPGDTLRFRGIDIGEVTGVVLTSDLNHVDVTIDLLEGNQAIAAEDSQFWIQRARVSLGQVSGLDTVLGAKYLGVAPGRSSARKQQFIGIETPLAMTEGDSSEVRIRFAAGDGLELGHPVRYRGIKVGEVILIELTNDQQAIEVAVRLVGSARQLAKQGTEFWIERPRLDLTEIRGLDTLLSGNYIALEPGSHSAPLADRFVGLSEPPPLARRAGSLEIELDATARMGVVRGAPVMYRGLEVGRITDVGLAKDGATVKITIVIDAQYVDLVRDNSKWWMTGGLDFKAGLTGIQLSIDSFSAWLRGGVAFATPPDPGKQVVTGHRFTLEPLPQSEWLEWQPRIAVGRSGSLEGIHYPSPVALVASWKRSLLGIPRRQTEKCWGLALSNRTLALPVSFIQLLADSGSPVVLETSGTSFPLDPSKVSIQGGVGFVPLPPDLLSDSLWPEQNVSSAFLESSVLLVVGPQLTEPVALDATRLEPLQDIGLRIAPGVPLSEEWMGLPVVDSASGNLYGLLARTNAGWTIASLAPSSLPPK